MTCNCKICVDGREYERIIAQLPTSDREWMEQYYEQCCNEGLDAGVNQAILDGTWPSAVEILEHSLLKAQQYRKQNGNDKK